jgi:hypothetical protein
VKGAGLLVSGVATKMLAAVWPHVAGQTPSTVDSNGSRLVNIVLDRKFLPNLKRLSPITTSQHLPCRNSLTPTCIWLENPAQSHAAGLNQ